MKRAVLLAGIAALASGCQSTGGKAVTQPPRGTTVVPRGAEAAPPVSPPVRYSVREQECLALAIYWEARGEGESGMLAVGWTVLNRVASPAFPATACAVVYDGRLSLRQLRAVEDDGVYVRIVSEAGLEESLSARLQR